MEDLRCLLGISKIERISNLGYRELLAVDERIYKSIHLCFGNTEGVENSRIPKRLHE